MFLGLGLRGFFPFGFPFIYIYIYVYVCMYIVGDEDLGIQTNRLRAMPGVRTSESTNRVSLGKYKWPYASVERLQHLRMLRIPTCPREVKNQGWKSTSANRGRGGRFVTNLGSKEGGRIKYPSLLHLMLYTHLASHINEGMTYEQCQPIPYLSIEAF